MRLNVHDLNVHPSTMQLQYIPASDSRLCVLESRLPNLVFTGPFFFPPILRSQVLDDGCGRSSNKREA